MSVNLSTRTKDWVLSVSIIQRCVLTSVHTYVSSTEPLSTDQHPSALPTDPLVPHTNNGDQNPSHIQGAKVTEEEKIQISISQFLSPILSLSKEDHSILMNTRDDASYRERFISERLSDLSNRQVSEIATLPDFVKLLRMIWVVRVAGSELRGRTSADFAFYAQNNQNVLHVVSAAAQEDLKSELGNSLGAVMRDVYIYKDDLFRSEIEAASPTQSGSHNYWRHYYHSTSTPYYFSELIVAVEQYATRCQ